MRRKTIIYLKNQQFYNHAALAHVLNRDCGEPSLTMLAGISTMDFRSNEADRTASSGIEPAGRRDRYRGGRSVSRSTPLIVVAGARRLS
jgi:hypothetical protein